jgi:hypothetical protein
MRNPRRDERKRRRLPSRTTRVGFVRALIRCLPEPLQSSVMSALGIKNLIAPITAGELGAPPVASMPIGTVAGFTNEKNALLAYGGALTPGRCVG